MQNRQIKFRGRRINTPEWVYGFIIGSLDPTKEEDVYRAWFIHEGVSIKEAIRVDPETIGQFTGLLDKNGSEIYEGDIIDDMPPSVVQYGIQSVDAFEGVGFNLWGFYGHYEDIGKAIRLQSELEIIGNIHENPELLNQ
jgi:uncharacterized phage protein (TIGR01671 family)